MRKHTSAHTSARASAAALSEGIVRWIKKKTGPAAEKLADKDALAAAEKAHEVVVVAYFKELKVRGV